MQTTNTAIIYNNRLITCKIDVMDDLKSHINGLIPLVIKLDFERRIDSYALLSGH